MSCCIVLCDTVFWYVILYCILLYRAMLDCIVLCCNVLCYVVLYCIMSY